jgi:glycosyltransferase involved in cell wall biosynthesis
VSGRILIIVQNLSVPRDRRVWLECQALVAAGHTVSVICPMGAGDARREHLEGVDIHRYPAPAPTKGPASFVWEFVYCWLRTLGLTLRIWRQRGFDVIQACNPPDTYVVLALLFKPFGVRFVYDQHDLCPELYLSKFADPSRFVYRALLLFERLTYLVADQVISTNESYRRKALGRGRKRPEDVTVVRNGPKTGLLRKGEADPELRRGRAHLCCWVGVMGSQDGVDLLIRAVHHYVTVLDRHDCSFTLLGSGDSYDELVELVKHLELQDYVTLPGWAGDRELIAHLSTADLGLAPDPSTPFNNLSTMNKTMEYMAFGLPVVTFDLIEARVSAEDAAVYVPADDIVAFATTIGELLDDPERRRRMGEAGRLRAETVLDWSRQVPAYTDLYDRLLASS